MHDVLRFTNYEISIIQSFPLLVMRVTNDLSFDAKCNADTVAYITN